MTTEPRTQHDYGQRDIEAAKRVLIDLGQVLGSWFADSIVVVGGWVPDLLLPNSEEPHVGASMSTWRSTRTSSRRGAMPRSSDRCWPRAIRKDRPAVQASRSR